MNRLALASLIDKGGLDALEHLTDPFGARQIILDALRSSPDDDSAQGCGLTLRDKFAAAAMQGTLAAGIRDGEAKHVAPLAYLYADRMLAERDRMGKAVNAELPDEHRPVFFTTASGHWAGERVGDEWCDWGDKGIICRTADVQQWWYAPTK